MKKKYSIVLISMLTLSAFAQVETFTFSGYDGAMQTLTATTATVNDEITIVFEDVDIINNFYTENRSFIHLFGGLDTSAGGFQDAPMFNDLADQPQVALNMGDDASVGPNTFSITINLTQQYDGVADGTDVFGFNLLFQNEFGGGGNNQTVNLFIDLVDAAKDSSTLTNDDFSATKFETTHTVKNKTLKIVGSSVMESVVIYNMLGQRVFAEQYSSKQNISIDLQSQKKGIYIVNVFSGEQVKTFKTVLH